MDCGHRPEELQHFHDGIHQYAEYQVFGALSVVLCNFCWIDFLSYKPEYFGVLPRKWKSSVLPNLIRVIDPPERTWDAVCQDCERRLAWLDFLLAAREHNAPQGI